MANVAVIGAQWGDEGKGKVVDVFGEHADVITRFQGGNNAGHTIVVHGKKVVLHLVPAAALHEGKTCLIGNGVVVDADVLLHEVKTLRELGHLKTSKIMVSDRAHLIMPYHKLLDKLREKKENSTVIGTTGRGIGPAYADKAARLGIRCGDLLRPDHLKQRLEEILPEKNCLLQSFYGERTLDVNALLDEFLRLGEAMRPFIADTTEILHTALESGKKIMFEGAQGALLDIDHGTYPFVTSSNTTSGGGATGTAAPPSSIHETIAITKAYTTRVGSGPFPTELEDDTGALIQRVGHEFGATTGRKRRCGWLDLVALRYAKRINGFTGLALTKIDVLCEVPEVKVCVGYELNGKKIDTVPSSAEDFGKVKPIYRSFKSWKIDPAKCRTPDDLPKELHEYISFVEEELETKSVLLSIGPDRDDTLLLRNPFKG
jgi:adenylosuccinate synthase